MREFCEKMRKFREKMEIRRKNENFVIKFIILKKRKQNFSQKIAKIHQERLKIYPLAQDMDEHKILI